MTWTLMELYRKIRSSRDPRVVICILVIGFRVENIEVQQELIIVPPLPREY
jgi:hypothetical protein